MAGSSLREPPGDGLLSGTLLTLITPDSRRAVSAKAGTNILCVEHELPTATVVRSSQATPARLEPNTNTASVVPGSETSKCLRQNPNYAASGSTGLAHWSACK